MTTSALDFLLWYHRVLFTGWPIPIAANTFIATAYSLFSALKMFVFILMPIVIVIERPISIKNRIISYFMLSVFAPSLYLDVYLRAYTEHPGLTIDVGAGGIPFSIGILILCSVIIYMSFTSE